MTLKELYLNRKQQEKHLIPNSFSTITFLQPYFSHPENYDARYCAVDYASLELISEEDSLIDSVIAGCLYSNVYRFQKLFETLSLDYNPIWNVDGTETTTYGATSKTMTRGAQSEETVNGARSSSSTTGSRNNTESYSTVPYEETDEYATGKTTATSAAATDTASTAASTDTKSRAAYTDTDADAEHTVTLTRSGNIGVTSSQSLISQERAIAEYNYMDEVMQEVINAITIPYWGQISNTEWSSGGSITAQEIINAINAAAERIIANDNANYGEVTTDEY